MKKLTLSTMLAAAILLTVGPLAGGCKLGPRPQDPAYFVKPTIGVLKFENRAPFPLNWSLGDGMADILVDRLVATRRYHVVERPELARVLGELRLQSSGATRGQGKATPGRLKNVKYLIKGTVTDFGHISTAGGWFKTSAAGLFGSHAVAVMGMTFYVVDVESGQIICSESLEESVRASDVSVKAKYKGVAMGGSVFYRTPLGKATAKVMDRAVRRITAVIASQRWQPKIASLDPDGSVILNGGANRYVRLGRSYEVRREGKVVIDPDTGDVIARRGGSVIGVIRIIRVEAGYSVAEIVKGHANSLTVGLSCRVILPPGVTAEQPGSSPSQPNRRAGGKIHHRRH